MIDIPVLYQDEAILVINKPSGISVHRNPQARHETSVQQELRLQTGVKYHPIHRLDRATSGVVIFSSDTSMIAPIAEQFNQQETEKVYLAAVRGYVAQEGTIERELKKHGVNLIQEARTDYRLVAQRELPFAVRPFETSRYSLVKCLPKTGRTHQIRRHMTGLNHPIIGDTTYGDGAHNQSMRDHFNIHRLLLHSLSLQFRHPVTNEAMKIEAPVPEEFKRLFADFL